MDAERGRERERERERESEATLSECPTLDPCFNQVMHSKLG